MTMEAVDAEVHATTVDLSGLLSVLGANLYSSPEVAIRELVQNAHDACTRRGLETDQPFEAVIEVGAAPKARKVWIEDNGAGLTREEVKRYLATIGAGYTRVLRETSAEAELIGAFGLGFLSAYMVAKRLEVHSTSFQEPQTGLRFLSDSGRTYAIERASARCIGTRVEIELKDACADIADLGVLERVLRAHCRLLRHPIRLAWSGELINDEPPPWRSRELAGAPPVRLRRERMAFAETFETHFAPLCTIPIERTSEADPGEGLLWLQDALTYGSSDNRRLAVFVRGMRVAANERELLPAWAGFVSGVYESDRLVPTASREALQKEEAFAAAREQIARELSRGLAALPGVEPESWRRALRRHNEPLLGAAIADDQLFYAVKDELLLPTTEGDLTARATAEAADGRIYVAQTDEAGLDGVLARVLGAPIVDGMRYGAAAFARKWTALEGSTLVEVGSARGLDNLFPRAQLAQAEDEALSRWFGEAVRVRPARFSPPSLPMLVIDDADAALKAFLESDAADARLGAGALALARAFTAKVEGGPARIVIVNLDCPAVRKVLDRRDSDEGGHGAMLLVALAELLGARGRRGAPSHFGKALEDVSTALIALLEAKP